MTEFARRTPRVRGPKDETTFWGKRRHAATLTMSLVSRKGGKSARVEGWKGERVEVALCRRTIAPRAPLHPFTLSPLSSSPGLSRRAATDTHRATVRHDALRLARTEA